MSVHRIAAWAGGCIALILLIVCIALLSRTQKKHDLILYGNVDVRQVDIGFRVAGQVDEICFEEGDSVKEGQLLSRLNEAPYDDLVRQAASNVEAIKADLKHAQILLKRRKELIQIGGVSQEDLDDAQARRDQLQANLSAAQAALAVAKDNLSYTKTYAPACGIILTRIREPGTVVNPSDPVLTLSVSSPVWIRAYVAEPELGLVRYGMDVEVRTDTPHGTVYRGKVGFISPVAEFTPKSVETTALRTDLVYRLRIYIDHPDQGIKQGMPVTVKLLSGSHG